MFWDLRRRISSALLWLLLVMMGCGDGVMGELMGELMGGKVPKMEEES